jgi:microcin C transport system substrate-binding protein
MLTTTLKKAGLAALTALVLLGGAQAQEPQWRHATSLTGEPKYLEGFERYDYVNPDAPKGGAVRLSATGSFDTFNPILPQGEVATGLGLVYESLMESSLDEVSTQYGLIAEALSYPDDFSSVTFRLNPKAKWQDGTPITPEDVVWSFEQLIKLNPSQANYYHDVEKAEKTGDDQVTFTFSQTGNRELPHIMSQLLILPRHWWEGTDANGKQRNIGASTLESPLGSGPYRIKSFSPGRTVVYERVPDYWAANERPGIGMNNFDEIRYEYFRDTTVEFEAFKGDQFDWWDEDTARRWAQEYNFAAVTEGRIVQELFPQTYNSTGIMVGFIPNVRLDKFKDERVRRALNYAFDFEELNRTRFYGQYERVTSYFYGLPEFTATGLPEGEELEILESVRDLVPPEVFTEPYENAPPAGDPDKLYENLRTALDLLTEAGYALNGDQLVDANGQQLSFEILLNGPTIEPIAQHLATNLQQIGIAVTVRTVDSPQYINRLRTRDYEMIYTGWVQSASPGNEQRDYWGSQSANAEETRNYAGISDPGIDALIDKIIFADDRETLEAATRALDRVLLAHNFVMPSYALRNSRIARWNRFSHPEPLPEYAIGFPTIWWYDEAKAAQAGNR